MTSFIRKILTQGTAALVMAAFLPSAASAKPVDPKDYPELSGKALGQVRHIVKLGNQLPGDWSGYGGNGEWEYAEHYLGFHSAFSVLALALAQQQYTPAYRELYKKSMEQHISKIVHSDVWERWLLSSRGGSWNRKIPDMDRGWIDPIAKDNNMLKAYILVAGALYESFYGDMRFEKPDAFTFRHWVYAYGNGRVNFRYSLGDIARILNQEVVDSQYVGAACEPGEIFWACNSASNAGFLLYDHVHGTNYSQVVPKVKQNWIAKGGLNPATYTVGGTIQTAWDDPRTIQKVMPAMLPMTAGYTGSWGGIFNNMWDPEFTKAAYYGPDGTDRNQALKYYLKGDWSRLDPDPANYSARWQPFVTMQRTLHLKTDAVAPNNSVLWGFFLSYAAEVGDREGVDQMLAYADRNFGPVGEGGEYFYPRNDDYSVDREGNSHGVVGWTGNVFLTLGRLNKGDGFRRLLTEAWTNADRNSPEIVGVNDLTTNVNQAWWDGRRASLIVTLSPGPVKSPQTNFNVLRLDEGKPYKVFVDGKQVGVIKHGAAFTSGKVSIRWEGDKVSVQSPLSTARSFVFTQS